MKTSEYVIPSTDGMSQDQIWGLIAASAQQMEEIDELRKYAELAGGQYGQFCTALCNFSAQIGRFNLALSEMVIKQINVELGYFRENSEIKSKMEEKEVEYLAWNKVTEGS